MKRYNLKAFRIMRGLTQAQMAKRLNLATNYYKAIENGTYDPSIKVWLRLRDVFKLSVGESRALEKKSEAITINEK